jgi:hypothetical protein
MNPHPKAKPDQPPRAAAWLLGLFASGEEKELVLGDLSEEYFERALQVGRASARRWYWRQTLKSIPHFVGLSFRAAPVMTMVAVAAGFAFRRLMAPRIEPALFAFIERTQIPEHHFGAYRFLASTGIDIAHLFVFLMAGVLVAVIARRHAMAPAMVLSLIYAGMTVFATCFVVAKFHDLGSVMRLKWYFSDDFAIVFGAALVRTIRSNSMHPAAE